MDPHSQALRTQLSEATPTGEYTWRAPSPPRITIPHGREGDEILLPSFNGMGYDEEDKQILETVIQAEHAAIGVQDWKYEWRRQAQAVLSFLYLGPSSAARDTAFLAKEGITMLVAIRDTKSAQARLLSGEKVAKQLGIEHATVDVNGYAELISAFPSSIRLINNHLIAAYRAAQQKSNADDSGAVQKVWGKVLVFCESGNERSATVAAAYLMGTYQLDLVPTIQYVQSRRFCIAIDDPHKHLLRTYQDILEAQRAVLESRSALPPPRPRLALSSCATAAAAAEEASSTVKRRRDLMAEEDGNDVDMDQADDEERFAGRRHFIPFHDPTA